MRTRLPLYALILALPTLCWLMLYGSRPPVGALGRAHDGLWFSRALMHRGGVETPQAAATRVRDHGITKIYPFLGPPDTLGWPGYVDGRTHHRFEPDYAHAALRRFKAAAPEIQVLPWTGGVLGAQITLRPGAQRTAWFAHLRRLIEAGAHGVHFNIEPLPSGSTDFLSFLRAARAALGPRALISVAAFPPASLGRPAGDSAWRLAYLADVCRAADEVVVMGYDTGHRIGLIYETLIAHWVRQLDETLPRPEAGGCRWSMGVPAYEDDRPWHRPEVETLARALSGVRRGLAHGLRSAFDGVTLYADWTIDATEWATFDRDWRGVPAEPNALHPERTARTIRP
jgi:hypothetical protein